MKINYAALTKKGKKRKENQDRVAIAGRVLDDGNAEGSVDGGLLAVICDGVDGAFPGAKAASMTSEKFVGLVDESNPPLSIFRQLELADKALRNESGGGIHGEGMASTIAGVYLDDNECIAFNAGDTRVYEIDERGLRQLSDDHTRAQAMVDALFARCAEELPTKTQHTITRYIGGSNACKPAFTMWPAVGKDARMIVCSDGAYRLLGECGLQEALDGNADLLACCQSVYEGALAAGSDDDISVIVLERAG